MSNKDKLGFNSRAVHAGYHVSAGPVNPPVERSSTYIFRNCEDGAARFASEGKKGIYSRLQNPNCEALEKKIAALEGGFGGIATASGMAAVEAVYFACLDPSSHVVSTSSVYGPSRSILEKDAFYRNWGVTSTFLDTSNIDAVREAAQTPNTRLIFLESPANPTLMITDIAKVAEIAREVNALLVIDNTFCSPYLQNPLLLGADIVLHSMTKSIGGHANAVGGMLVAKTEEIYQRLRVSVTNRGGIL